MRNLTKTIAAVSLLVPASAYPLGIGDIKLHSALNQKLDAEIALLVSANENISDISVKLAPPEKFDEAGVPWNYFLSKIKFKAVTLANGKTVVKLSSNEALREPFLDFLLEVTWASGNLYREFTVLVDPPAAYTQAIVPVINKPAQVATSSIDKPVKSLNRQVNWGKQAVDGQYGLTSRTDSMWKIAEKTNVYDDVSIEQMMMAIYEANPKAFYKRNVNALMAGKTLDIPEKSVIVKLSKQQALIAFKQQDDEWRGRVSKKTQQSEVEEAPVAFQLELEAPVAGEIAGTATVVAAGDDDASVGQVNEDPEMPQGLIASGDEGLALQARMQKLEQQLDLMQKMLVLKDEQIANLQNSKKIEPVADSVAVENKESTKPAEIAKVVKPIGNAVKTPTITKDKPKKSQPAVQPEPESDGMSDYFNFAIGGAGLAILAGLGLLWWRKRKDEEETDTESMFAAASEISLPDSAAEELSIPIADESNAYDVGTVGESSFLSEFTPSDFDAFDTDHNDVDPISEADVYLAYGRYQQAEDLMRQAIEDFPERDECKLKLLEIFYANENKVAFETYAQELAAEGKHEDASFWASVVEMGVELDPDSSLYSDRAHFDTVELDEASESSLQVEQAAVSDDIQGATNEDDAEIDFDLSVFEDNAGDVAESASKDEVVSEDDENVLDFDLSVFDLDGTEEEAPKVKEDAVDSVESIDFDLSSMALDDAEQEEITTDEVNETEEVETLDFDLGSGAEANKVEEVEGIELGADLDADIDLESFDFSSTGNVESKDVDQSKNITEADEGIEDFDFDFDLDIPGSGSTATDELDAGVSDLTDMDELETKLDLAKAYIDMGDAEAAKDIAKEVLAKGNDKQKVVAQEIIDRLK